MGHRFRFLCQVETGRLLQLMGVLFAVVLVVQYFELPYGNVLLSLFSAGKVPIVGKSNFLSNSETIGNTTLVNGLNSTDTFSVIETANITETSEGKDRGQENGFFSERNVSSDNSFGLVEDSDSDNEPSSENLVDPNENSTVENVKNSENGSAPEKAGEPEHSFSLNNVTTDNNSLLGNIREEDTAITSKINVSSNNGLASPPFALSPMVSSPNIASPTNLDTNSRTPVISVNHNTSPVDEDAEETVSKDEKPGLLQSGLTPSDNNSSMTNGPAVEKGYEMPTAAVVSVSEMNDLLLQSRASSRSMKPRWSSAVDQELLNAKSQIENAPIIKIDAGLYAPLYRNVSMFKRSYELMEQTLKVYIYREGGKPVFHQPVLKGIYASEGWFMKVLVANKYFVTKKPRKAHLFYLPFSSRMLEETLYVPNSHSHKNLIQYLKNYLDMIVAKYPFWNRTGGADHFLVACHDWAPSETRQHMANCIRALCNSDIKEGFRFGKDVSLPETYVRSAQNPLRDLGGKPPSQRRILAFFAGNMHGYLRPILLQYWGNKDPDMKFFSRMPRVKGKMNYIQHMKSSKYCICAKGYEVNSPRVVEAIFYECVPVIISDNFVPPFFEVLDWESFAVFVLEKDIPNLKNILLSISKKRYLEMQMRVKKVQQHFIWHPKPVKYDLFHMILHSIWYNRVFQIRPR